MLKFCIKRIGTYFGLFLGTFQVLAEPVPWDEAGDVWYSSESAHFICHYSQRHALLADAALRFAEQAHRRLMPYFQTRLDRKTQITLVDPRDQSNGWASPLPYAQIRIYIKPPDDLQSGLYAQGHWLKSVITHEYVHTLQLDMAEGFPWGGRFVLGRNPFFFPFIYTPKFLKEGVAVVFESDAATQDGRLYSSYYEMQMRMEVAAGLKSLDEVSVHALKWPRNTAYLYGAYFYEYLFETYGQAKVHQFFSDYSASWVPSVGLNASANATLGADFNQLWLDFQRAMQQRFSPQIFERQRNQKSGTVIARSPYFQAVSTSSQGLFRLSKDGQTEPQLQRYGVKNKQWENLFAVDAGLSLAVNADAQVALTRQINWLDGRKFADGFVGDLQQVAPLTRKGRFSQLAWLGNRSELLGRRIVDGRSELWHFDLNTQQSLRLWQGDVDVVLGQIAISSDAKFVVASMKFGHQSWSLYQWQPATKQWQLLLDSPATEVHPSFQDRHRLLYSADAEGVFDVYRLDLKTQQRDRLTYELGGAFYPLWQPDLGLVYQSYETEGYALRLLPKPKPEPNLPAPAPSQRALLAAAPIPSQVQVSERQPYSAWQTLRPYSWLPIYQQTETGRALGVLIAGQDALGRHQYSSIVGWNSDLKTPWLDVNYLYDNRWQALLKAQALAPSVAEYQVTLVRNHWFLWSEDQGRLGLGGGWKGIDQQDEWQLGVLAETRAERSSLFHPSVAWGHRWQTLLEYERYRVEAKGAPVDTDGVSLQAYASWSWPLPQKWSLSSALQAGISWGDFATERYQAKPSAMKGLSYAGRRVRLRGYPSSKLAGHGYAAAYLTAQRLIYRFERGYSVFPYGVADAWGRLFADVLFNKNALNTASVLPALGFELNLNFYTADLIVPLSFWVAQGLNSELGDLQMQWRLNVNF
jgi:hypothetical protein